MSKTQARDKTFSPHELLCAARFIVKKTKQQQQKKQNFLHLIYISIICLFYKPGWLILIYLTHFFFSQVDNNLCRIYINLLSIGLTIKLNATN